MTAKTELQAKPARSELDTAAMHSLLDSMATQADVWQREARNAVVANHPLEEQYCLGIRAGLNMAAGMIKSLREDDTGDH